MVLCVKLFSFYRTSLQKILIENSRDIVGLILSARRNSFGILRLSDIAVNIWKIASSNPFDFLAANLPHISFLLFLPVSRYNHLLYVYREIV